MDTEISYFSLASLAALAIFLALMIPRSIWHLMRAVGPAFGAKDPSVDPWLVAIGLSTLVCAGLAAAVAVYSDRSQHLLNASAALTFTFLFFALPAVFQVLRAWSSQHGHKARVLSHPLVLLAILSLPASMAIPTAALLRTTQAVQPQAAPAGNPAAALVDERFFTDSEIVNDPEDYPAARFLQQYASLRLPPPPPAPDGRAHRRSFSRQVPMFTAFWIDQTTNMLSFDATDTFGVLVSPITHVRSNWAFSLAVWGYKLLCALILVAVTFDALLRPI
ncbi:MAG TPA: hypothetical protein VIJ94_18075, partial [Caulobacteraceae bacterium]